MPAIHAFSIYALDLPFKKPFKHAAADRSSSNSIMLKCITDSDHTGFGESLPREYVTGTTREDSFLLLLDSILPKLIGRNFQSLNELTAFFKECDGKVPSGWLAPDTPQTAAWAAVDLALLDGFGNAFSQPIRLSDRPLANNIRYSAVFSAVVLSLVAPHAVW